MDKGMDDESICLAIIYVWMATNPGIEQSNPSTS